LKFDFYRNFLGYHQASDMTGSVKEVTMLAAVNVIKQMIKQISHLRNGKSKKQIRRASTAVWMEQPGGEAIRPSREVLKLGGDTDPAIQTSMDAHQVD
jgi:hypothetical protein